MKHFINPPSETTTPGTSMVSERGFLGKYRGLALYIGSLILVIVIVLSLNLYFSAQIEQNTRTIEAASRQTTLVQQISRQLFMITSRYQKVLPYQDEKHRLRDTLDQYDAALTMFLGHGHMDLKQSAGTTTRVVAPSSYHDETAALLSQSRELWSGYRRTVYPLFDDVDNTQTALLLASEYVEENNDQLASLSAEFSQQLRRQSEGNLAYMRAAQVIAIVFALSMFFLTIFRTVRRLMENDHQLEEARKETHEILTTVREGLFLVGKDLLISGQHSKEMESIFRTSDIAGRSLPDLLKGLIDHQELNVVKGFMDLLFAPHIIEDLTGNLNPLERVEVAVPRTDGVIESKFLNFEFYRVMEGETIQDILVSVRDITNQIQLEQELEATRLESEKNLDILLAVLKIEPKTLENFLASAQKSLDDINDILREPIRDRSDFRDKTQRLFSRMHRLKGDAYAVKLDAFARQAHQFESALDPLRNADHVEGMDFLPLTIRLDKLLSHTEVLQTLSTQLSGVSVTAPDSAATNDLPTQASSHVEATPPNSPQHNPDVTNSSNSHWNHLTDMANQIAEDIGKPVALVTSGLSEVSLNDDQKHIVNHVCIQLIRNAVVHGIEPKNIRAQCNKPALGRVDLRIAQLPNGDIELRLRDDGQGIDLQAIRRKLVEEGITTPEDISSWPDQKVITAIFRPGFSTTEAVDMHSGRGVGMDVIREQIQSVGGRIRIQQIPKRFCEFEIRLPAIQPIEGQAL